ncbi:hypothetical protein L2K70_04730 [Nocardioides KLBMP 9356]|uniref:Uncharacterized protein n=1 Tax=Nocardioides potassii TaxID=2911371 RepID=A0ABS9H6P0_9ACTN|nr:hypothetical protein [Nocardioides potassii]MCF6376900.1 hypothetical protein [Nocardioides potassii]
MAKVKNVSGEDRIVQGRLVLAGALLEVPADEVWSYTIQEPNWAPGDDEARTAHDEAYATAHAVEEAIEENARPAGNASRDVWAAWVVATERATEDDITDMSRDQLRDTYGQEG